MQLGELETFITKLMWTMGSGSVKDVHEQVQTTRNVTKNTVQSTLERLNRKGVLRRSKCSHAYIYEPKLTREQLTAQLVGKLLSEFDSDPSMTLAAFVEQQAPVSAEKMAQLRALITELKAQES
ncbi:BlaI/MecI/CopY family transcriptional regulator [Pseudidiomarina sp. CB1]|uniref:BlaI/MecI/CopY family transcriptional regulator n=1 Tax=Pseudidiomarina sp. CB1 TaxID=2972484 RepID=UPI0021635E5F|nr:BlaI/MecI/CopY family transcriptional regulator [Pseudidiomarina sp. CB1]